MSIAKKTDPTIVALTAEVKKLQSEIDRFNKNGGNSSGGGNGIHAWRTTYKGDTITHDGVKHVWCDKHKREGQYDGLYYRHPHDHDKWAAEVERKKALWRQKREKENGSTSSSNTASSSKDSDKKLQLDDRLKALLCTTTSMSESQLDDIINAHNAKN